MERAGGLGGVSARATSAGTPPSSSPRSSPVAVRPPAHPCPAASSSRPARRNLTAAAALAARLAAATASTAANAAPPPPRRQLLLPLASLPPPPPHRARAPISRPPAATAAARQPSRAPHDGDDDDGDDAQGTNDDDADDAADAATDNNNDDDDDDDPDAEGGRGSGRFRFWYDEQRFRGRAESCVVAAALEHPACGGVRTGGHPKRSPVPGPLGWSRPGEWDLLWSPARTALRCAELGRLRPGQLCSALPGMAAITRKRRLVDSLLRAYGEGGDDGGGGDGGGVCPLTFELPVRLDAWRAHLDAGGKGAGGRWMLKTAEHMGKGLALMRGEEAWAAASAQTRQLMRRAAAAAARRAKQQQQQEQQQSAPLPASAAADAARHQHKPFLLAQRYVEDPLLLRPELRGQRQQQQAVGGGGGGSRDGDGNSNSNSSSSSRGGGRKFGLRLWMVVTGVDPLRAHVFRRGLVLFSDVPYLEENEEEVDEQERQRREGRRRALPPPPPQQPQPRQPPLLPLPPPPPPSRSHVTNYAANADGAVWDLEDLERALGPEAFGLVWRRCMRACALAAAAALASAREEKARLRYPLESCFELIGLDFLVDARLRPWLLEANSTPSLSAEHSDARTLARVAETKAALVRGAAALLGAPGRFDARYAPLRAWVAAKRRAARGGGSAARSAALEREAARLEPGAAAASEALVSSGSSSKGDGGGRGREEDDDDNEGAAALAAATAELERAEAAGFEPLYADMPYDEVFERGWNVPFGAQDFALRDVWRGRQSKKEAAAAAAMAAADEAAATAPPAAPARP